MIFGPGSSRGYPSVLLVRTDRLGDLLMNVPLMRRLRQNFPKSFISVLCSSENQEVLLRQPDIDEVIGLDEEALGTLNGKVDLLRRLRSYHFECIVVSNPAKFFHLLGFALGIPTRAGFNRKWGFFLNRSLSDRKWTAAKHEIDFNLELLDPFCEQDWDNSIDLGFENHPLQDSILGKFGLAEGKASAVRPVAVHVTTSDPRKRWPVEKFGAVVRELLEHTYHRVVLVGGEKGDETGRGLGVSSSDRLLDLSGRTTLTELAIVLRNSACLVSLDSGPFHLAWMQKVPVVGLFVTGAGGSHPKRWGVYPSFVKACQIHKNGDEIAESEVIEGIYDCLRN